MANVDFIFLITQSDLLNPINRIDPNVTMPTYFKKNHILTALKKYAKKHFVE
jgi:hypothetical protein